MNIEHQFKDAAQAANIPFSGVIIADGKLHRDHIEGHRPGSKNGAYILHADSNPAGWGMDYTTNNIINWRAEGQPAKLSKADWLAIDSAKKQRQKELEEAHHQTALKAQKIWKRGIYADAANVYCYRKKINPHGAKTGDSGGLNGVLILPLYDENLKLVNLQFIQPDSTKRFMTGGKKKACYWWIGKPTPIILIAEGYATAASLHEATGHQVFIAFDAGNLINVAQIVRAKRPRAEIIIAADNDESGTGQKAARSAALAGGCKVLIPPKVGDDWNDHLTREG